MTDVLSQQGIDLDYLATAQAVHQDFYGHRVISGAYIGMLGGAIAGAGVGSLFGGGGAVPGAKAGTVIGGALGHDSYMDNYASDVCVAYQGVARNHGAYGGTEHLKFMQSQMATDARYHCEDLPSLDQFNAPAYPAAPLTADSFGPGWRF